MKNIIFLFALSLTTLFASAQSLTPRFGTPPRGDNTGRTVTYSYAKNAYAATLALKPDAFEAIYTNDSLTGAQTITIATAFAHAGDLTRITFVSDSATAGHVVTFSTGTAPSATLTVDKNQRAGVIFMFDGAKWVEIGRAKE